MTCVCGHEADAHEVEPDGTRLRCHGQPDNWGSDSLGAPECQCSSYRPVGLVEAPSVHLGERECRPCALVPAARDFHPDHRVLVVDNAAELDDLERRHALRPGDMVLTRNERAS